MELTIQYVKCWKCGVVNRLTPKDNKPGQFNCSKCKSGILTQAIARGYVYILSNPSMKGLVKIGFTERSPEERLAELQGTGVPTDFVLEYKFLSADPAGDEKKIHTLLDDYRINKKREFFEVSLELAIKTVEEHCQLL